MLGVTDASSDIVSVDVAWPFDGGIIEVWLNVPVAPVGSPVIVKVTSELKPFMDAIVIVDVPEVSCGIVREVGDAAIEKSGVIGMGATVTVKVIVTS